MSQLSAIMTALSNISLTVGGVAVAGYAPSDQKMTLRSFPARILSALNDQSGDEVTWLTLNGSMMQVRYRVTDLLLWRALSAGAGIETDMSLLVAYKAAYYAAIRTNRKLGLTNVAIDRIEGADAGIYEYPIGSGMMYSGVKIEMSIIEIIEPSSAILWGSSEWGEGTWGA